MSTLNFKIRFSVPPKIIYNALLDFQEVQQYTRSPAIVEPKVGGQYKILDGRITGEIKKLVEAKLIEMTWKFNDWTDFSNVTIELVEGDDYTDVQITQSKLPKGNDPKKLEDGWRNQIFIPMSKIRGYPIEDDD